MLTEGAAREQLLQVFRDVVGSKQVLTDPDATRLYRTGFRFGGGDALAVVRPASLLEQWRILEACVRTDVIILLQASNTGLTGGSTPAPDGYDRDLVIISTTRISRIFLINGGRQVIALPGATLHELETLLRPLGREPHSVIGSSCFGASVIGGICNNSGGALVRRGPAYTEMALFGQVGADGELRLVNHLGISLGDTPEEILSRLDAGNFEDDDVLPTERPASDRDYEQYVRNVDADTPARFNADKRRLFEASGSAGKIMVFAVRLDTFEAEADSRTFYVGSNDPGAIETLRRMLLAESRALPISAEYLHRDAFDLADRFGKDQFLLIRWFGTDRLPMFLRLKRAAESLLSRLKVPLNLVDRLLVAASRMLPDHLPRQLREWRKRFEHHLVLRVAGEEIDKTRALLDRWQEGRGRYFLCKPEEGERAFLHRFVVAGAAVRYRDLHRGQVGGIVALDIALPRNANDWFEKLPSALEKRVLHKVYYGHFLCHVLHQDYIIAKGEDPEEVEHQMLGLLDSRGAKYPAEHNVGHLYEADANLSAFYRKLDPQNRFNPGIGRTPRKRDYEAS